jgi:DNA polymerase V|tara:strand:- start:567 stop:935 length:369 start_codon:yes stop_codon:yes gene_type:complete
MEIFSSGKLSKVKNRHAPEVSKQTGFPSPATHYAEPSIDLHKELIANRDATFFVRIAGDELSYYNIWNDDVLLIDRSLKPKKNDLVLVIIDGEFRVVKFPKVFLATEFVLWGLIRYIIHYAR